MTNIPTTKPPSVSSSHTHAVSTPTSFPPVKHGGFYSWYVPLPLNRLQSNTS